MAVTTMAGSPRRKHQVEDATRHHPRRRHLVAGPGAGFAAAAAYDYARGRITVMLLAAIPTSLVPPVQLIMILQLLLTLRMLAVLTIIMATMLDMSILVMLHIAFVRNVMA